MQLTNNKSMYKEQLTENPEIKADELKGVLRLLTEGRHDEKVSSEIAHYGQVLREKYGEACENYRYWHLISGSTSKTSEFITDDFPNHEVENFIRNLEIRAMLWEDPVNQL
jgi:hypothetical protein